MLLGKGLIILSLNFLINEVIINTFTLKKTFGITVRFKYNYFNKLFQDLDQDIIITTISCPKCFYFRACLLDWNILKPPSCLENCYYHTFSLTFYSSMHTHVPNTTTVTCSSPKNRSCPVSMLQRFLVAYPLPNIPSFFINRTSILMDGQHAQLQKHVSKSPLEQMLANEIYTECG